MSDDTAASPEEEEPKPLPLPKLGTTLGSYRLLKLLGVGGMGRVYVAEHQKLGRKVALKLLLPEFAANPEVVQRFFNEARAVNQINHPNIVEIVDFIEDPHGFNYFIMELLDGTDLRKTRDADGPFLLGRTVSIGKQMASALAAAHGQGIIHRDIKPDNVVLLPSEDRPNFIKLLDFGIAKLSSGVFHEQKTRLGMVLGTPGYMSPEQAFGRPVDGRSDIYSLGVLLHWMLVDKLPSAGNLPMKSVAKDEPPPDPLRMTARGQPIPSALAELIGRCLRFDPDDRIQTMDRVRAALAVLAPTEMGGGAVVRSSPSAFLDAVPAVAAVPPNVVVKPPTSPGAKAEAPAQPAPPGTKAPAAPEQTRLDEVDLSAATRLQTNDPPANDPKNAATRIKLDSDVPPAPPSVVVANQDELAAFPPKRGGTVWIAAIAAVVVLAIGAAIVLRKGPPPVETPPPQVAALPQPTPAAPNPQPPPPEPNVAPAAPLPPPPEPAAVAAQPAPSPEPAVAPQEPEKPAPEKAAAAEPNAVEPAAKTAVASPPAKAGHHGKSGKKPPKAGSQVDDTSILDPLAE